MFGEKNVGEFQFLCMGWTFLSKYEIIDILEVRNYNMRLEFDFGKENVLESQFGKIVDRN